MSSKFQSTHPHGVRHSTKAETYQRLMFQSTHPHGVRHRLIFLLLVLCQFQSTHPHGVRHIMLSISIHKGKFQSTHPHGVRLRGGKSIKTITHSFNPRTRTGCDQVDFFASRPLPVSIHAPARGATLLSYSENKGLFVSIHAPARGATSNQTYKNKEQKFQSTHPHGVRQDYVLKYLINMEFQSTHPHGVRRIFDSSCRIRFSFNPRTRTGCDSCTQGASAMRCMFQSTHPHGVRLSLTSHCLNACQVSIHAPARGATPCGSRLYP